MSTNFLYIGTKSIYTPPYCVYMVWRNSTERPKRYLISVGRDRLREKILSEMWQICEIEGSTMADEIWDGLYMHVERHRDLLDKGDGSGLMDKEPQPDFSLPEENEHFEKQVDEMVEEPEEKVYKNIFDDVVKDEAMQAAAVEVEEVLDEERTESRVVDSRNMYGHKESA